MPRRTGAGHSHTLDLLRGLSALAVVALHFGNLAIAQGRHVPLYEVGELGVHMFFVLSGFFIGRSVLAPRQFDSVDFGVNRVLRIVPNYLVSLLVVVLLIDPTPLLSGSGWADTLAHVFFVQGWFIDYRVSISPVRWTLSVEWMFYLFMLAAAGLIRNRRGGWWVAGCMLVGALVYRIVIWSVAHGDPRMLNFGTKQLPGTLDLFGCGLLVALLVQHDPVRRWAARSGVKLLGVLLALVGFLAAASLYWWAPGADYYDHRGMVIVFPLLFAIPAAALILFFQQFEGRVGPFLRASGLAFVGVISYSIYLFHTLVIKAFNRAIPESSANHDMYLLLTFVAIFVVSIAAYYLVEKPFMERRARARTVVRARLVPSDQAQG